MPSPFDRRASGFLLRGLTLGALSLPLAAQTLPEVVSNHLEISAGLGNFSGALDPVDSFGFAVESIGDLDGDGVPDLAVGTDLDDDGGTFAGAVWILFLNADGTVKTQQKISALAGGFGGVLAAGDRFGSSVAALGDLDGDGVTELAVGANFASGAATQEGAVWILFMKTDGTVKAQTRIDGTTPALAGQLSGLDHLGRAVEALGDLDGDGLTDLAAGAWKDGSGSVYVLFLDAAGGVSLAQRIAQGTGGFPGTLVGNFGIGLAALGDLDGDGNTELVVGANAAEAFAGELWVLFLASDGTVKSATRIAGHDGGFEQFLPPDELFGTSLGALPDRDGNGVPELAVGAVFDSDGAPWAGAVWILALEADGQVSSWQKVSDTQGSFSGGLTAHEFFGAGVAAIDTDGDGLSELAVGASNDDDFLPVPETGSVWMLTLNPALWRDHGLGLAGGAGLPRLVGAGELLVGTTARLTLSDATPGQLAAFVLGGSVLSVPFKGGSMFPLPQVLSALLPVDGLGERVLEGPWPAGVPSGFELFAQAWIVDPGAPFGMAASNGVSARAP